MGVDRHRVCELYVAGPESEGSGSGYRVGDRLVLTARHVIAPALSAPDGQVLVRPAGVPGWLSARVDWQDADADAALIMIEDEGWRASAGESVLRWGELAGSEPVPCAAVGFPWASVRLDRVRDTAHVYGQLAPLGQLKAGRLDLDVTSASPSAREGGSPWAGMSGAGLIADNHLVGVITVDPARYQGRLVAVPVGRLLTDEGFRVRLADYGVRAEPTPIGAGWYLQLPGEQTVSLAPAYGPVGRRIRTAPSTLLRPEHGLVPFLGRQALLDQITAWCQGPPGTPVLLVTGGGGSGKTRLGREACVRMLVAGWDAGIVDDRRRDGTATTRLQRPTLLAAVPNQAEVTRIGAEALVVWAHLLYPGPSYWNPLRPDLLAEQHLAETVQLPALAISAVRLATEQRWESVVVTQLLAELTRGAPNQPAVRTALKELLAAELSRIIYLAIAADGAELADLTSLALQLAPQPVPALLFGYLAYMPMDSVRLAVLAATLTSQQVTQDRAEALAGEPDAASRLAQSLNNLSGRLGVLGRREEALAAIEEAVDTYRELAAARPDEFRPGLAMSLYNLANWRTELGRREEALAPAEEAVDTYRELAAARPDEFRPGLAASLNNLSNVLAVQGRREHALAAAEEALAIRREPAAARPDDELRPELAGSLYTLAMQLDELGRLEEALAAAEEAVDTYRELAVDRPDEFRRRLAMSLNILAFQLGKLGRREEALAAAKEAVDTNRELAAARPDAFRPELARSLNNLAIRLRELGRREEALAAAEEAVDIRQELAARWPHAHQHELRRSLQVAASLLEPKD
jgi:tetratricopeptide (TPR) repeat protein